MGEDNIKRALLWTFKQTYVSFIGEEIKLSKESPNQIIVDNVRKYFNDNDIEYSTFDYNDLKPYL